MIVYRFNNKKYKDDISGIGAYMHGGRWNDVEQHMLYSSQQISLALLELLVHLKNDAMMMQFNLLTIKLPDNAKYYKKLDYTQLPKQWDNDESITKFIGSNFLKSDKLLYLMVPSVVVPLEYNVIINPKHKLFEEVIVTETKPFVIDSRLI